MKLDRLLLTLFCVLIPFFLLLTAGCGSSGSQKETASISLSSDAESIYADGSSSVSITAVVTNSSGNSVTMNTGVAFSTNLGIFRNGKQTYNISTIDDSGVATVSLISSTIPGIAEIRCESSGVSQSIQIHFVHYDNTGLPVAEEFGLAVQYHNISGLWMAGLENTVTAYLGDLYGNAVQDGIPVSFKTYNTGGFFDPDTAVTSGLIDDAIQQDGTASSTLYSAPSPAPAQGMVSVTAETDGGSTTHITSIAVTPEYDSNIMYVGTNGGGVYKSTDSGRHWENISRSTMNSRAGQNWIDPYIKGNSAICVDPDNHNTVYVGTGYLGTGNLYRSLDGGMNWNSNNTEEWYGLYNANAAVLTVLCDDGNSDHVWIGTEGKGILYADDGEHFQPSGGIVNVSYSPPGKGDIESVSLGYSAKTETWTLTCFVPEATVNSPSIVTDIDPIGLEENPYAPPPVLTASNPDTDGRMDAFQTSSTTLDETWTVKYLLDIVVDDIETPDEKGTVIDITSRQAQEEETWTLTCIYRDMSGTPLLGDTSTIFSVEGSVSGKQANANVNTPYTSEMIDFTIIPGQAPFIVGDVIEFTTMPDSFWQVSGTISGMQAKIAHTGIAYTSDNREIGFTIHEGQVPFTHGDYFTFDTYEASPVYWTVEGSSSGLQAGIAQNDMVYISDNQEISFIINEGNTAFEDGDQFILQATASKISHGWTVWDIVKVPGTHGAAAQLYAATGTGVYRSSNGGQTWDETGNFPGDYVTCLDIYHTPLGNDILYAGTENAGVWVSLDNGTTWTHYSDGMALGTTIKDVVLDPYNHYLYCVAWYGPRDAATGQIFVHPLKDDQSMDAGGWTETGSGLTGSALYAIAADSRDYPSEIYTGGEGINFFRTSGGVSAGTPSWQESADGLSNRIMARIPVLFSGECIMSADYVMYDNIVFLTVYIQDANGNPPIAGSTFNATYNSVAEGGGDFVWTNLTYGDVYTYQGTFRDPGNGYTNFPYRYTVMVGSGDEITLTYVPLCNDGDDMGAGCSGGGEQTITIPF